MIQVRNLIIVRKFNKGIVRMVTSWIDVKTSSSFAIPSYVI